MGTVIGDLLASSAHHSPPQSRLHILVLNSVFDLGGAERVTFDVIRRLDRTEFDVVFCALYRPGMMEHAILQAGYPLYDHLMRNKFDARVLSRLSKVASDHCIDLIYLATQPLTLFWGVLFSKLTGVPVVALVSNTVVIKDRIKLRTYRWLMPMVDRIVTVGKRQTELLEAEVGVDPDRITVVHNGVDVRRFAECKNDVNCRREAGFRPDTKIVGVVARLVRLKAVDILLEAARIVTSLRSGVEFAIVGDGPEMESLRSQARALGVDAYVRFLGLVDDPARIIGCFDIAVLCSRTEALPMSVLEYMAAGKPCVVSDVGSVRELVTDGLNGFVIEPDDPRMLATTITQLLDDPVLAIRMGVNGRQLAMNKFGIDLMVGKTAGLFHDVARQI